MCYLVLFVNCHPCVCVEVQAALLKQFIIMLYIFVFVVVVREGVMLTFKSLSTKFQAKT